jgi:transcription antitermination factor NusG
MIMRWHVVIVRSGSECDIAADLNRSDIETFCPLQPLTIVRFGQILHSYKAIFAGYVFARWQSESADQWHLIRHHQNVLGILGGEFPMPIPEGVVESWQARADDDGIIVDMLECLADLRRGFKVGDRLRISHGSYQAIEGVCVWVDDKTQKVGLKIALLGRECVLIRRYRDVESPFAPVAKPPRRRGGRRGNAVRKAAFQRYISASLRAG